MSTAEKANMEKPKIPTVSSASLPVQKGKLLVEMKNVNVKYGPRTVRPYLRIKHLVFMDTDTTLIVLRSSKTSTGRSDKVNDGTSKVQTVSNSSPSSHP